MPNWLKVTWIFVILTNLLSIIWFVLGSTAYFQRSLDLVSTVIFIIVWVPSLVLVFISIVMLVRRKFYSNVIILVISVTLLFLSIPLFKEVDTQGWLYDNISSDPVTLTEDGKYEYSVEIVNLFQKNSYERLYLKDLANGNIKYIPIDINDNEISGIGENEKWALLIPTEMSDYYELTTTNFLPVTKKRLLVNVNSGISERIE